MTTDNAARAKFPFQSSLDGNRLTIRAELTLETFPQFMLVMGIFEQVLITVEDKKPADETKDQQP